MKLMLTALGLTMAAASTLAAPSAFARHYPPHAKVNSCPYELVCQSAFKAHRHARYRTSSYVFRCHIGPCPGGTRAGRYYYYYWR